MSPGSEITSFLEWSEILREGAEKILGSEMKKNLERGLK